MLTLYSYFRSSTSYRVRIALNLKGLAYDVIPVNLLQNMQRDATYVNLNPQGLVPMLVDDAASNMPMSLTQSLVILEYLEETYPTPALLPKNKNDRWHARSLAQFIACEMHPLNNLRVLKYLSNTLHIDEMQKNAWYHHWMHEGLRLLEHELAAYAKNTSVSFAMGESPTWVDICLVPQMYNARRFGCDLTLYPRLNAIEQACLALETFQRASPSAQKEAIQ